MFDFDDFEEHEFDEEELRIQRDQKQREVEKQYSNNNTLI